MALSAEPQEWLTRTWVHAGLVLDPTRMDWHDMSVPDIVGRTIASAAREALAPLGVVRKGRSRCWIDDHGWWLVNIEFQPSGFAKGCYLNVGVQHFWVLRNYLCFEGCERPLGDARFVAFEGDEELFRDQVRSVADVAARAVVRRRREHGEGDVALERLLADSDDLNAGIAATLLGDRVSARSRLTGNIHRELLNQAGGYLDVADDGADARVRQTVAATRTLLGLDPTDSLMWRST